MLEAQGLTGYTSHNLALLARQGKVKAQRLTPDRTWIFACDSLLAYTATVKKGRKPKPK